MTTRTKQKPAIVLNFKAYPNSSGSRGIELAMACEKAAARHPDVEVIACPQAPQLELIASKLKHAKVFAQAVDAKPPGKFTGALTINSVADSGCAGTLVNHNERKATPSEITDIVKMAGECGMRVLACADSVELGKEVAKLNPWGVAVEIPELIGTGRSVSTVEPKVVTDSVKQIGKVNPSVRVLVGAGVSTGSDVAAALKLGATGVLLSSRFVDAKDPEALLEEMALA